MICKCSAWHTCLSCLEEDKAEAEAAEQARLRALLMPLTKDEWCFSEEVRR